MNQTKTDVLIVGAGPAGLATAIELKRSGVANVTVLEREPVAGGMPRLCHHTGFGVWDLRRVMTGPHYARRYAQKASAMGVEIRVATTVTGWDSANAVTFSSPQGLGVLAAQAILLATGVRERPRAARLVAGSRPQGIFTTGSLQRFVDERHLPVGKRAVIVGAEEVSLSAFMTVRAAGLSVAAITTELPQHQMYLPYLLPKWGLVDMLTRTPVQCSTRIRRVLGRERVEGVEIEHVTAGDVATIACDTVVFTGDWIPEYEVARQGGLQLDRGTRGPQIDGQFRTSRRGVFAAGNLLRGAESAATSALEGRAAAVHIGRFLQTNQWSQDRLPLEVSDPIRWVFPNCVSAENNPIQQKQFTFRVNQFVKNATIQVQQGHQILHTQTLRQLRPNKTLYLRADWLKRVNPNGDPLHIFVTD